MRPLFAAVSLAQAAIEILGRRRMPRGKRRVVAILLASHASVSSLWRRSLTHLHFALTLGFHVFLLNCIFGLLTPNFRKAVEASLSGYDPT
jgi:hypothetical protein